MRIRLQEQPEYEFIHEATVRPRDVNFGGHLGNDSLIALLNEAELRMFNSLGFNEGKLGDDKTSYIVASIAVNYKTEAFMFDELIIDTHVSEPEAKGFGLSHRVRRGGDIVALAEVYIVVYDYMIGKPTPVPDAFIKVLFEHKQSLGSCC